MKRFRWFVIVFLGVGALMLLGSIAFWNKTRHFLARAQQASGTVVELIEVRDNEGSSSWKPVISFTARNGRKVRFADSVSSRPAGYDVGEGCHRALSSRPARRSPHQGLQFTVAGHGVSLVDSGLAFTGIGGGILFGTRASEKRQHYLMAYGNAIETEVQGVDRNTSVEINGQNPWRISSQWLDPKSNTVRVFHSENLWFDPSSFMKRKKVTVLLDPNNPSATTWTPRSCPMSSDESCDHGPARNFSGRNSGEPVNQIEYKTILLPYKTGIFQSDSEEVAAALNKEGAERWRLSQIVLPSTVWGRANTMVAILERTRT